MKLIFAFLLALLIRLSAVPANDPEAAKPVPTWISNDSKSIQAEFIRLDEDQTLVVRMNGREIKIPMARLSQTSREQARTLANGLHLPPPNSVTNPVDFSVWPNASSFSNSDPWLPAHHDQLKVMRPRVLVINFSNEHSLQHIEELVLRIISNIAEGSRWHGYADPSAPAFLQYEVFRTVDLRDTNNKQGDSSRMPGKPVDRSGAVSFKYAALYDDVFARAYGVVNPEFPDRYLSLKELVDKGLVHEVWVVMSGNIQHGGPAMWETIELKPKYDSAFKLEPGKTIHCGNGADPEQPWIGRSLRIGAINASRGSGCFLESLSHSFERMGDSGVIPYLRTYFLEYAGFDFDKRFHTPFNSLYAANLGKERITYPNPTTMIVPHAGKMIRVVDYVATCGNVHFMPNGRSHYDLESALPVMSTIESWRMRTGPNHTDLAKPWTPQAITAYRQDAPDCMGPWLVYWRQNMPGLNNKAIDNEGKPMKNWWPFLFY